jgi:Uma2 family endonuclease
MSIAPTPPFDYAADLLTHLSDIPPHRIRLHPPPGTATERDVIEARGPSCELIDGVLVDKPMGYYESRLGTVLAYFLEAFLEEHDLGIVFGEHGMVRVAPRQVREPDVSFVSWDHFPGRVLPNEQILSHTPDLAVEVLSPDNTVEEMKRKRREYFAGGARLVWQVYPEDRRVHVYTAPESFTELTEDQTLDGGEVLPGFTLTIRRWFERAGRRAAE